MSIMFDKSCPLCRSKNTERFLYSREFHGARRKRNEKIFTYYKCYECSAVYLYGVNINELFFDKYYGDKYYKKIYGIKNKIGLLLRMIPDHFKEKAILESLNSGSKDVYLLDVGMGRGEFLNNLKDKRFIKFGIDLKPGLEYLDKVEKIYNGDFLEKEFKTKFDVVSMWHVLEHSPYPEKIINKTRRILKKNGVLIFSTPNIRSLGFNLSKAKWFHLDPPRHVILYNKKNAMKLCRDCGFSKIKVINGFIEFPTDLFWSVYRKKIRYFIYPFYPIVKLMSRDTLIFICQK